MDKGRVPLKKYLDENRAKLMMIVIRITNAYTLSLSKREIGITSKYP